MATFYRVLSWIFSLVYGVGLVALTGIIANHFFSDHVTADAEFVVIAVVVGACVWVWRRYGAPLLNLIPRREYQRFCPVAFRKRALSRFAVSPFAEARI